MPIRSSDILRKRVGLGDLRRPAPPPVAPAYSEWSSSVPTGQHFRALSEQRVGTHGSMQATVRDLGHQSDSTAGSSAA